LQVPASWSDIPSKFQQGGITTVDLRSNRLGGEFPREWATLRGAIITLALDENAGLTGCAPLDASTTVTFTKTRMSGVCKADTKDIEAQQVRAVQERLVPLLGAGAQQAYLDMLNSLVKEVAGLGDLIKPGQANSQFYKQLNSGGDTATDITLGVDVIEGTTYITSIEVNRGAGLNLTHLVPLVRALPRLDSFFCRGCNANTAPGPQDLLLPSQLPQAAPVLKSLELIGCGLQGPLPKQWGSWTSLEALNLGTYDGEGTRWGDSFLNGSIPSSYANISLKFLDLSENRLTGQLPAEFGSFGKMPIDAVFYLGDNPGLRGSIPLTWSYFSLGLVEVGGTKINVTCIPDGLTVLQFFELITASPCSGSSPQVGALLALQLTIYGVGGTSDALATWNGTDRGGAGMARCHVVTTSDYIHSTFSVDSVVAALQQHLHVVLVCTCCILRSLTMSKCTIVPPVTMNVTGVQNECCKQLCECYVCRSQNTSKVLQAVGRRHLRFWVPDHRTQPESTQHSDASKRGIGTDNTR
jgi:hypothetical protein